VDPDVASEAYVGSHQRLDRYKAKTFVVSVVMAKSVVYMADDGCVALPAINRSTPLDYKLQIDVLCNTR
jgi:hypothetical protein